MTLCFSGRGSRFPLPCAFRLKGFLWHGKLANLAAWKLDLSGLRAAFHKYMSGPHLSAGRSSLHVRSRPVLHALVDDTGPKNRIPEGLFESPFEVARTEHHVANSKRERLPQDYVLGRSE